MTCGKELRVLRLMSGKSLREVEEACGIKQSHIGRIERGDIKYPKIDTIIMIMNGMGYRLKSTKIEDDKIDSKIDIRDSLKESMDIKDSGNIIFDAKMCRGSVL